jgi:predicted RNA-binding Zn-ribbon protein involved in translation (DUF1610 family)
VIRVDIVWSNKYNTNRKEAWVKKSYYCPACGKNEVFEKEDSDDYYEGAAYICVSCGVEFTMPSFVKSDPFQLGAIRDALKEVKE